MSSVKIGKNYIYNLIYQILLIVIPIVSMPYVSRVLGEVGSGKYSFTFSIATYFTVFASLGFSLYAQRLVAGHQGDVKKQSADFWEVFLSRLVPVSLALFVYFILIITGLYGEKYTKLMIILSVDLVAVAFDISFFYQGNENFGEIVLKNALIKLLSLVLIFTLVKTENDLWIYTCIQSGALLITNLFLWTGLKGKITKVDIKTLRPLRHLRFTLVLFLPTIATSVYVYLDKILIGLITGSDAENGNYEYAEKIIKTLMTLITALGTVMIPHNAKKIAVGDEEGVKENIYGACRFVWFLGVPLTFGVIALADVFIPLYLGDGYPKAALMLKILSPLILIIGFSNVFGLQYLIPKGCDKRFTVAIFAGALLNLTLNLVLIPFYAGYGAAVATVIAEFAITAIMAVFIRREISIKKILLFSWRYLLSGAIMFTAVFAALKFIPLEREFGSAASCVAAVVIGAVVYFAVVLILKDKFTLNAVRRLTKKNEKN